MIPCNRSGSQFRMLQGIKRNRRQLGRSLWSRYESDPDRNVVVAVVSRRVWLLHEHVFVERRTLNPVANSLDRCILVGPGSVNEGAGDACYYPSNRIAKHVMSAWPALVTRQPMQVKTSSSQAKRIFYLLFGFLPTNFITAQPPLHSTHSPAPSHPTQADHSYSSESIHARGNYRLAFSGSSASDS